MVLKFVFKILLLLFPKFVFAPFFKLLMKKNKFKAQSVNDRKIRDHINNYLS